ncbi:helix-turn-helix transcriptional regulator [Bradyrhizobium sp. LHD-71]|uniref:helix-turn-helix transcriptional regulator n=1 Tax=Bradyrhizobium sp. LHD-71 TaxID=3072141 RepID=UPI0028106169|nr:helix-turn-helix transcriptional regulator [Bradyrhizobium sp. LHD-71]MDQ8729815.1 helix-turn-helix transcriptional regulator [Bradyrhizobium sp. LHD-71]
MPEVAVADDDVIGLGKKLDQFSEMLTPKEQLILYAMIKAAGRQFLPSAPAKAPVTPPPKQTLPKLSNAFDAAFLPGRAAEFGNQSESSIGPVGISGGVIDTMNVILVRDLRTMGVMGFGRHREAGPIGEHEIATTQLLIPDLQRAAAISGLLDVRTMAVATFETVLDTLAVPVVLTGPQLQIVHANRAARALLAEGDLLRSRNNMLTAQSSGVGAALAAAVSQAVENESAIGRKGIGVPARTAQGDARVLHVLPLRYGVMRPNVAPNAVAAIFIAPATHPPRAPSEVVAALFDLTAAEVRVFEHITAGRTMTETAEALGVGISTVKTHLVRLFDKVGVHRQADLVALGASFALPIET